MIAFGVLFLGVLIYVGRKNKKGEKQKNALNILDEQYSKGEISKKEYLERKETINAKE